jgi:P-type Ca2+ transporter type 2C
MTGESFPVHKVQTTGAFAETAPPALPLSTPLAERTNMVFGGSLVTRGHALALVVSTGRHSELGTLLTASRVYGAREKRTVLQQLLKRVAFALTWVALACSLLGGLLGLLQGLPWQQVFLLL